LCDGTARTAGKCTVARIVSGDGPAKWVGRRTVRPLKRSPGAVPRTRQGPRTLRTRIRGEHARWDCQRDPTVTSDPCVEPAALRKRFTVAHRTEAAAEATALPLHERLAAT